MHGLGTDEAAVFGVVEQIGCQEDWDAVVECFKVFPMSGGNVRAALEAELSDDEYATCKRLFGEKGVALHVLSCGEIADKLAEAMRGLGTDEDGIDAAVRCVHSQLDWDKVCACFAAAHHDFHEGDLVCALGSDLSEDEMGRCTAILKGKGIRLKVIKPGADGSAHEGRAATKIQSLQRGRQARVRVKELQSERSGGKVTAVPSGEAKVATDDRQGKAATKIQALQRGRQARKQLQKQPNNEAKVTDEAPPETTSQPARRRVQDPDVERAAAQQSGTEPSEATTAQAATKIQSLQRGRQARVRVRKLQSEIYSGKTTAGGEANAATDDGQEKAATKIQALQRGRQARVRVKKLQSANSAEETTAPLGETKIDDRLPTDDGQDKAATKIQALHRGRQARIRVKKLQSEESGRKTTAAPSGETKATAGDGQDKAATKIQALQRGRQARKQLQKQPNNNATKVTDEAPPATASQPATDEMNKAATRIQSVQRGRQARRRVEQLSPPATAPVQTDSETAPEAHTSADDTQTRHNAEDAAATKIQAAYRGKAARTRLRADAANPPPAHTPPRSPTTIAKKKEAAAAVKIQALHRGRLARRRVVVLRDAPQESEAARSVTRSGAGSSKHRKKQRGSRKSDKKGAGAKAAADGAHSSAAADQPTITERDINALQVICTTRKKWSLPFDTSHIDISWVFRTECTEEPTCEEEEEDGDFVEVHTRAAPRVPTSTASSRRSSKSYTYKQRMLTLDNFDDDYFVGCVREGTAPDASDELVTSPRSALVLLQNGFTVKKLCKVPKETVYAEACLEGIPRRIAKERHRHVEASRVQQLKLLRRLYAGLKAKVSRARLVHLVADSAKSEKERALECVTQAAPPAASTAASSPDVTAATSCSSADEDVRQAAQEQERKRRLVKERYLGLPTPPLVYDTDMQLLVGQIKVACLNQSRQVISLHKRLMRRDTEEEEAMWSRELKAKQDVEACRVKRETAAREACARVKAHTEGLKRRVEAVKEEEVKKREELYTKLVAAERRAEDRMLAQRGYKHEKQAKHREFVESKRKAVLRAYAEHEETRLADAMERQAQRDEQKERECALRAMRREDNRKARAANSSGRKDRVQANNLVTEQMLTQVLLLKQEKSVQQIDTFQSNRADTLRRKREKMVQKELRGHSIRVQAENRFEQWMHQTITRAQQAAEEAEQAAAARKLRYETIKENERQRGEDLRIEKERLAKVGAFQTIAALETQVQKRASLDAQLEQRRAAALQASIIQDQSRISRASTLATLQREELRAQKDRSYFMQNQKNPVFRAAS